MRRTPIVRCLLALPLLLECAVACAEGDLQLALGAEYTSGKYGGTETTEIQYFPVTGRYAAGPWLLKLTVPYLRIAGIGSGDRVGMNGMMLHAPLARAPVRRNVAGLGDVLAGATYAMYENSATGVLFDVTGKIKFGTADPSEWLGTGENDYSIQVDLSKQWRRWAAFAGWGWKAMGNPAGTTFKNPWYGSLGVVYRTSGATSLGWAYDYRGAVIDDGGKVGEASLFLSQKISQTAKIQGYVLRGFSIASPDWGGGIVLSTGF